MITSCEDHIRIISDSHMPKALVLLYESSVIFSNFDADGIIDDEDLSTITHPKQSQKSINVDFPSWVIDPLDKTADRVGVPRQSSIKVWLVERLGQQRARKLFKRTENRIRLKLNKGCEFNTR